MASVANGKEGDRKAKKTRPDGTDRDRYKNLEKWSYRKWAWEFLRRNHEFITECKRVKGGTEKEKQSVAQQFGLKQYKPYTERYRGESGTPKFVIGSISSWTNLDCDKNDGRLAPIRIGHGQVLIRFDLASAIDDKKALDKQLRLAEQRIKKRMAAYERVIKRAAEVHKFKAVNFGIYIRLLDHLALNKTPLECAKLVFPSRVKEGRTDNYLRMDVKDPIKAAKKLANEGYRYLSVLTKKPDGKGIPIEF